MIKKSAALLGMAVLTFGLSAMNKKEEEEKTWYVLGVSGDGNCLVIDERKETYKNKTISTKLTIDLNSNIEYISCSTSSRISEGEDGMKFVVMYHELLCQVPLDNEKRLKSIKAAFLDSHPKDEILKLVKSDQKTLSKICDDFNEKVIPKILKSQAENKI